jgi:hypothetical protein
LLLLLLLVLSCGYKNFVGKKVLLWCDDHSGVQNLN